MDSRLKMHDLVNFLCINQSESLFADNWPMADFVQTYIINHKSWIIHDWSEATSAINWWFMFGNFKIKNYLWIMIAKKHEWKNFDFFSSWCVGLFDAGSCLCMVDNWYWSSILMWFIKINLSFKSNPENPVKNSAFVGWVWLLWLCSTEAVSKLIFTRFWNTRALF